MARLWLTVHQRHTGPGYGHPVELWWRDVALEGTPEVGDRLFILRGAEEPEGTVDIEVRNRYWDLGGRLNLELRRIVQDPDEKMERDIQRGWVAWAGDSYYRHVPMPWRTEDGPLTGRLEESGWRRWT